LPLRLDRGRATRFVLGGPGFVADPSPSSFGSAPPTLSGAAELGEKIRSSLPLMHNSNPFQQYYRRAREFREGHSMKWNDRLLSDSLEASKTVASFVIKNTVAELPLMKVVVLPIVFYHKWELDAQEKAAEFWEGSEEWEVDRSQGEEFMAIVDEMIKRQKSKGKRELLNLQSSINYDDFSASSRCRKGKAQLL